MFPTQRSSLIRLYSFTTNKIIGNKGAEYMQIGKEEIEQYFNGEEIPGRYSLDSIESRVNEALGK